MPDFNNETNLDITTAHFGSNRIGIHLGYGNGSFTNETTYTTGNVSLPAVLAVSDMNKDYCLDIVVANTGTR